MRSFRVAYIGVIISACVCSASYAIPDDVFNDWRQAFAKSRTDLIELGNATPEQWSAVYRHWMDRIDFQNLRPTQIDWLRENGALETRRWGEAGKDRRAEALQIAREWKDDSGAEGAAAAALCASLTIELNGNKVDPAPLIYAALTHPGVTLALEAGSLISLNVLLAYQTPPDVLAELKDEFIAYVRQLPTSPPVMASYSEIIFRLTDSLNLLTSTEREELRLGLLRLVESAYEGARHGDPALAYFEKLYARAILMLTAEGLVGKPAPDLVFTWTSGDPPLATLADLRGTVVVLDFWATWCGPCVGTFPEMRQLVEHYDGFPVRVIGVTSIQGGTQFPGEEEGTDASTAEEEFAQMTKFIKMMNVTWPIAFSRDDIFQTDYGVNGIPHIVIIDPAGIVRHRRLHPSLPLNEKAELIDAILEEFALPAPAAAEAGKDESD